MNWKRINNVLASVFGAILFLTGTVAVSFSADRETVIVFAAASTTNAMTEIGALFVEQNLGAFLPSFAASSTLAKQIENGAPAGIYLSANEKWMDYLEKKDLVDSASRFDLLCNRIVLVAPVESPLVVVEITADFGMDALLAGGYLAMGDPAHVPAGIYGKQALESLGVWNSIRDRVARQKDVRSALALVERGEVSLGLVYATDAAISDKVKVVGVFPESSHPPIRYPVALVRGRETAVAERFLEFLKSRDARAVFEKYGFAFP